VRVIEFAQKARAGASGEKFHFAHERTSPRLVHTGTELALHGFDLVLPGRGVGGNRESAALAAHRARVRSQWSAHNRGPCRRKPRKRGFRPLDPLQRAP